MDLDSIVGIKKNPAIPTLSPGDTVKVATRLKEGDKTRTQMFQGTVIGLRKGGAGASFTVRRVAHGVGIERTFALYSPLLEKVEILRHGKVNRAKLNYLRNLSAKKSTLKERRVTPGKEEQAAAILDDSPVEPS